MVKAKKIPYDAGYLCEEYVSQSAGLRGRELLQLGGILSSLPYSKLDKGRDECRESI